MHYVVEVVGLPEDAEPEEPVTVGELRANLRMNTELETPILERCITTARQHFEHETGRAVLPTVFRQHMTCWVDEIKLMRGPVTEVASVTYWDDDDDQVLLNDDEWEDDLLAIPGLVYFPDLTFPDLSDTKRRPVVIEFTAGWANVASVPADVKQGILLQAAFHYMVREAYSEMKFTETPAGFQRICNKYRTGLGEF